MGRHQAVGAAGAERPNKLLNLTATASRICAEDNTFTSGLADRFSRTAAGVLFANLAQRGLVSFVRLHGAGSSEHGPELQLPRFTGVRTVIESSYWRDEIRDEIRWLRIKQRYKRWSEKQLVLFERKLMLIAFQVRTLLERPKVNDQAKALKLKAVKYPKVGNKPFTVIGPGTPDTHFDLSSPEAVDLSILDVCNQLIHYYWMSTASERGRFTSVLVFSDYKRNICAYEFEVSRLIDLFSVFGHENSAVCDCRFSWSEKKKDYVMEDARGPSNVKH